MTTKQRWAEDISGKRFAVFGEVAALPSFLGRSAVETIKQRGGVVQSQVDDSVDYLVIGRGRQKGRAEAERKGRGLIEKGAKLQILDDAGFVHLFRINLEGARFFFTGGFEICINGLDDSQPPALARSIGAEPVDELDENVDYVVVGSRRAAGKTAAMRRVQALVDGGAGLDVIDETTFFELVRSQGQPGGAKGVGELIVQLHGFVDPRRLERALDMLKKESFNLYADVDDDSVVGVVRSQTSRGVYSSVLYADGKYACCSEELYECMGLQGRVCKHTLVLVLGLVQSGALEAGQAESWMRAASKKGPAKDPQTLADTLLRYKSAEAGEIDWRPTETIPEDFYIYG